MDAQNQIITRQAGIGLKEMREFSCLRIADTTSSEPGILRLFTEHPASVGESYREHSRFAFGFGSRMLIAGAACCVHGILPFLFGSTGSRAIRDLHEVLLAKRSGPAAGSDHGPRPDYQI